MAREIVWLAGPGASTAHRDKRCPVLTRRSVVANEPVQRVAEQFDFGLVDVFAPGRLGSRRVRVCRTCGREGE